MAEQLIVRAGLVQWPRLFQNLRSSRETDLTAQFPLHVVVAWIGNTEAIAMKHYLQVTDAHFEPAAKGAAKSAAKSAAIATQNYPNTRSLKRKEPREIPVVPMTPTGFEPVSRP
jgi:hypothetical protein